ncbi:MAG: hypothetical protein JO114_03745 [Planctomycetaceae bacterium]|nr:hypothetical protein [Planctomycetaceae bacterium]
MRTLSGWVSPKAADSSWSVTGVNSRASPGSQIPAHRAPALLQDAIYGDPNSARPRPPGPPGNGPGRHAELDARISEIEERLRRLEQPSQRNHKGGPAPPSDQPHTAEEENASLDRLEQRLNKLENGTSHPTKHGTG